MALCLTVLVAAGLLGRSLATLRLTDLGFDRTRILYASVNPWQAGLPANQVAPYVERLRAELSAIPGVARVATIGSRPLSGSSDDDRLRTCRAGRTVKMAPTVSC